jgi:cytidylate kinase
MLVGLIGPAYSGKKSIATYLTDNFGFKTLQTCNYTTIEELVHYSTNNWIMDMVVVLDTYHNLDSLLKRPFFLLVAVNILI